MAWIKSVITRRVFLIGGFFCLGVMVYLFLWGRLAPVSPIVVGFEKLEKSSAIIYWDDHSEPEDFSWIDGCITQAEKYHGLSFKHKPEIFFIKQQNKYRRLTGSDVRFKTFPVYGRVYVSPRAMDEFRTGTISLEVYVKHELSHSLLFQHMSLWRFRTYPLWLLEGLATHSSGMLGHAWYPDKKETYALIRQGNFMSPTDFGTKNEQIKSLNLAYPVAFCYSEFACILEDMMGKCGRDKTQLFIKNSLTDKNLSGLFKTTFGLSQEEYFSRFHKDIVSFKY